MSDPKPTSSDEPEVQREHSMDDATTVRYLILLVGGMVALAVIIFVGVNMFV